MASNTNTWNEEIEIENIFHEDESDSEGGDMSDDYLNSLCGEMNLLKPYQFEPEGASSNTDDSDESEISTTYSDPNSYPNRIGNKEWCQCQCCVIEKRAIDCLCCQEESAISEDKFEGYLIHIILYFVNINLTLTIYLLQSHPPLQVNFVLS